MSSANPSGQGMVKPKPRVTGFNIVQGETKCAAYVTVPQRQDTCTERRVVDLGELTDSGIMAVSSKYSDRLLIYQGSNLRLEFPNDLQSPLYNQIKATIVENEDSPLLYWRLVKKRVEVEQEHHTCYIIRRAKVNPAPSDVGWSETFRKTRETLLEMGSSCTSPSQTIRAKPMTMSSW